jgi:hypothetical protein
MSLELIGLALGTSFAAGINLYATVATLGLLERFGVVALPPPLQPLAHPIVIGVALFFYAVEFFADKIPYVDTVWDTFHTFIRPPAAAILAYAAVAGVSEPWRIVAALVAGGVALTSHGTKTTARAAVNTSPEPISNWILSVAEDGVVIALVWFAAVHPLWTLGIVAVLLALSIWLLTKLVRYFRDLFRTTAARKRQTVPKPS